jgi:hypothetical protein
MSTPEALRSYAADEQLSDRYADAMIDAAEAIERLTAERDCIKETLHDELAENLRLRDLGGALQDEGMTAFLERVIAERDALRSEVTSLRQRPTALEASDWRADALRYRWLRDHTLNPRLYEANGFGGTSLLGFDELDEEIDAAMEGNKP